MSQPTLTVPLVRLPHGADLPLPAYATEHAAAVDLLAAIDAPLTLGPLERRLVPTGISIALPPGYEGQVRARSGLAYKNGIGLVNGVGTIDADYRGEIGVLLVNLSNQPFTLERGMRIAQFVIARHEVVSWQEVSGLDESARGSGGFGSTGTQGSGGKAA